MDFNEKALPVRPVRKGDTFGRGMFAKLLKGPQLIKDSSVEPESTSITPFRYEIFSDAASEHQSALQALKNYELEISTLKNHTLERLENAVRSHPGAEWLGKILPIVKGAFQPFDILPIEGGAGNSPVNWDSIIKPALLSFGEEYHKVKDIIVAEIEMHPRVKLDLQGFEQDLNIPYRQMIQYRCLLRRILKVTPFSHRNLEQTELAMKRVQEILHEYHNFGMAPDTTDMWNAICSFEDSIDFSQCKIPDGKNNIRHIVPLIAEPITSPTGIPVIPTVQKPMTFAIGSDLTKKVSGKTFNVKVDIILTTDTMVITQKKSGKKSQALFPPLPIVDIKIRQEHDRKDLKSVLEIKLSDYEMILVQASSNDQRQIFYQKFYELRNHIFSQNGEKHKIVDIDSGDQEVKIDETVMANGILLFADNKKPIVGALLREANYLVTSDEQRRPSMKSEKIFNLVCKPFISKPSGWEAFPKSFIEIWKHPPPFDSERESERWSFAIKINMDSTLRNLLTARITPSCRVYRENEKHIIISCIAHKEINKSQFLIRCRNEDDASHLLQSLSGLIEYEKSKATEELDLDITTQEIPASIKEMNQEVNLGPFELLVSKTHEPSSAWIDLGRASVCISFPKDRLVGTYILSAFSQDYPHITFLKTVVNPDFRMQVNSGTVQLRFFVTGKFFEYRLIGVARSESLNAVVEHLTNAAVGSSVPIDNSLDTMDNMSASKSSDSIRDQENEFDENMVLTIKANENLGDQNSYQSIPNLSADDEEKYIDIDQSKVIERTHLNPLENVQINVNPANHENPDRNEALDETKESHPHKKFVENLDKKYENTIRDEGMNVQEAGAEAATQRETEKDSRSYDNDNDNPIQEIVSHENEVSLDVTSAQQIPLEEETIAISETSHPDDGLEKNDGIMASNDEKIASLDEKTLNLTLNDTVHVPIQDQDLSVPVSTTDTILEELKAKDTEDIVNDIVEKAATAIFDQLDALLPEHEFNSGHMDPKMVKDRVNIEQMPANPTEKMSMKSPIQSPSIQYKSRSPFTFEMEIESIREKFLALNTKIDKLRQQNGQSTIHSVDLEKENQNLRLELEKLRNENIMLRCVNKRNETS